MSTRQTKTPRQRAEEQLATAKRVAARLDRKRDRLQEELANLTRELDAALTRRDYLAQHPDLQQNPTTTTGAPTA